MLRAAVSAAFVVGLLVMAGSSFAQNSPRWVSNAPDPGFVNCAPQTTLAGAARPLKGLSMLQVSADTETKVSFWGTNGSTWVKLAPIWGDAASDTVVVIPAGKHAIILVPVAAPEGCLSDLGDRQLLGGVTA